MKGLDGIQVTMEPQHLMADGSVLGVRILVIIGAVVELRPYLVQAGRLSSAAVMHSPFLNKSEHRLRQIQIGELEERCAATARGNLVK